MSSTDQLSGDDANSVDGEGVWAPEIESAFHEGLKLFPPCGRRKHILQEEGGGKMYGRNELIARHILMRTGKIRTRKQVSSHIQVLNRRKAKADIGGSGSTNSAGTTPSPSFNISSSTTISNINNNGNNNNQNRYHNNNNNNNSSNNNHHHNQFNGQNNHFTSTSSLTSVTRGGSIDFLNMGSNNNHNNNLEHSIVSNPLNINMLSEQAAVQHHQHNGNYFDVWHDRPIVTQKIRLVEFSAFVEYRNNHFHNQQQQLQNYYHQQPLPSSSLLSSSGLTSNHSGFTRHSYIKIDYSNQQNSLNNRQLSTNKLERIDISQIQDKFPEISGPEGLFQRGPSDAFFLIKFWADLNNDYEYNSNDQNSYFGFSSHFEAITPYKDITCSTKACSYGLQVVEKVEKIYGCFNNLNGRYSYNINRSPMCEFMIQFIRKLRQLPRTSQMNSVLENFSVLQVITSESTSEILMCLAYVFEVSSSEQNNGPQYHVYKLAKD